VAPDSQRELRSSWWGHPQCPLGSGPRTRSRQCYCRVGHHCET